MLFIEPIFLALWGAVLLVSARFGLGISRGPADSAALGGTAKRERVLRGSVYACAISGCVLLLLAAVSTYAVVKLDSYAQSRTYLLRSTVRPSPLLDR